MENPCNGHGAYNEQDLICECYRFYRGQFCDDSWMTVLYGPYNAYSVFFTSVFFFLLVSTVIFLRDKLRKDGGMFPLDVKKLVFLFLMLACVDRVLYMAIDPHNLRNVVPKVLDAIGYGFVFPCVLSCYSLIVFYWVETYHTVSGKVNTFLDRFKKPFIILDGSVFVVEFFCDIMAAVSRRAHRRYYEGTWMVYFSLLMMVQAIGYLVYGVRLHLRLRKFNAAGSSERRARLNKITYLVVAMSCLTLIAFVVLVAAATSTSLERPSMWLTFHYFGRIIECTTIILLLWVVKEEYAPGKDNL